MRSRYTVNMARKPLTPFEADVAIAVKEAAQTDSLAVIGQRMGGISKQAVGQAVDRIVRKGHKLGRWHDARYDRAGGRPKVG